MTKERLEQIAITNYFRSSEDDGWEWKTVADEKVVAVMAEAVNEALEEVCRVFDERPLTDFPAKYCSRCIRALKVEP